MTIIVRFFCINFHDSILSLNVLFCTAYTHYLSMICCYITCKYGMCRHTVDPTIYTSNKCYISNLITQWGGLNCESRPGSNRKSTECLKPKILLRILRLAFYCTYMWDDTTHLCQWDWWIRRHSIVLGVFSVLKVKANNYSLLYITYITDFS
jgi:hypothetical protein